MCAKQWIQKSMYQCLSRHVFSRSEYFSFEKYLQLRRKAESIPREKCKLAIKSTILQSSSLLVQSFILPMQLKYDIHAIIHNSQKCIDFQVRNQLVQDKQLNLFGGCILYYQEIYEQNVHSWYHYKNRRNEWHLYIAYHNKNQYMCSRYPWQSTHTSLLTCHSRKQCYPHTKMTIVQVAFGNSICCVVLAVLGVPCTSLLYGQKQWK